MICAACSVSEGECPTCHTFWWRDEDGKLHGVSPGQPEWGGGVTLITVPPVLNAVPLVPSNRKPGCAALAPGWEWVPGTYLARPIKPERGSRDEG